MSIKERPDGRFEVRVATTIRGRHVPRKKIVTTKGEARRLENQFRAELLILRQRSKNNFITWEQAIQTHKERSIDNVSLSTLYDLDKYLNAYAAHWNQTPLDELSRQIIVSHIAEAMKDKTDANKDKLLKHMRAVFKTQIELGRIGINPLDGARFQKRKKPQKELNAMSRGEIQKLLYEAERANHPWYPIWYLTYQTGIRSMEGYELKATDVDLENQTLRISRAYCVKSKTVGPPKNREPRTVSLNSQTIAFLKELKLRHSNEEYLLPHFRDWEHGEAAKILRAFQKDMGIRETNFHSLRASFITHLLLNGVPVTKVQYLVGHKDLKTTQRYVRIVASDLVGSTDSIGIKVEPSQPAQILEFPSERS